MHLAVQKVFKKSTMCASHCVVPFLSTMKPNQCCSPRASGCAWKARAGAKGRGGTSQSHSRCFCTDVLKHPGFKCNLGRLESSSLMGVPLPISCVGTAEPCLSTAGLWRMQRRSITDLKSCKHQEITQQPQLYSAHHNLRGKCTHPLIKERTIICHNKCVIRVEER